jgi:hypothetical protein
MRRLLCLVIGSVLWAGVCSADPAKDAGLNEPICVAVALLEAFNHHDPQAMTELVSEDFELFYFDSTGHAELAARGREQLGTQMIEYFETRPAVKSFITGSIAGPNFVAFREQIAGGQSSLAIYEIREQLVRRAWYYPAESATAAASVSSNAGSSSRLPKNIEC